jgi:hypothetical protein
MVFEQFLIFMRAEPFEPFIARTVDGREYWLRHRHPEEFNVSEGGLTMSVNFPGGQYEVLDMSLIISLKTISPANPRQFTG